MHVAKRIKAAYKRSGLNYREFASLLGVSVSTAYNWVHGKQSARVVMLPRIARVLGVTPADLVS